MGKSLTIGALVVLLSALYLVLVGLLVPRLDASAVSAGHMFATVLIAVLVVPLRNRVGIVVGRLLRRDWQTSQALLGDIGAALSRTLSPEGLHAIVVDDLPQRLRIQGAALWMLEPPNDRAFVVVGPQHDTHGPVLLSNGAIARQIEAAPHYVFIPARPDPDVDWLPLVERGVRLVIPLRVGNRLIGIYGCQRPQDGDLYSQRVINVLLMLVPAIATALENVRAYTTIERLNEELRALDQLKDEFIQSVGHELRTPLTSLSLATQLLTRQSDMPPALAHVIRTGVAQLQALVERVLEFDLHLAPLVDGQHPTPVPVDLAPLLAEIVGEYVLIADAKGVRFDVAVPGDLAAWGCAPSLRRALQEVVDNAVRYSKGGTVSIAAVFHDGLALVSIADEGPGIPHDERDRLFAAFYRGSGTRSLSMTPGAGLGLSIARREIESLGGQIWLEDSGPSGSTMCVALPAVAPSERLVGHEEHARAVGA